MARRRKTSGWKARRASVGTAPLVQIGPDHPAWGEGSSGYQAGRADGVQGAIVKLIPPPGTPESQVLDMEKAWYASGAAAVKVMPVQDEVKVTVEGEAFDFTASGKDDRTLRQVALDRAARVTNPRDADALRELVDAAMTAAESEGAKP